MSIKDKYTDEEIENMESLIQELYVINEELNARVMAFHAKLTNEEKKVKRLEEALRANGFKIEKIEYDEYGRQIVKGGLNYFSI